MNTRHLSGLLFFLALSALLPAALADGFSYAWSRENEPHIVLKLSPEQIVTVGRERKLVLSERQHRTLIKFNKAVPRALGVESLGEPDCSCHISSALWTAPDEVTIWVERLGYDRDGSRLYYEVRRKKGRYTADNDGRIYAAGQPVSWKQFEKAVLSRKDNEYIQLSLPPDAPKEFLARVERLRDRKHFSQRL
jgi:hypothetical protein